MSRDLEPATKRCRLNAGLTPLPILDREVYLSKLRSKLDPMLKIGAMYNSLVGGIIKDPELMTIPIHDHAIVRGHAVFDTCSVYGGNLFRIDAHLERHVASAQNARIPLPFGNSPEENITKMREIIAQTVVATGYRTCNVRYYTTAGPGNFSVTPIGCSSAFYVVVYGDQTGQGANIINATEMEGIKEYTVDVPLKPEILARTKTNNYLLNVLTCMASQDKGGKFGILIDADGCIAESCVLNCVFVTKDRRLVTPPFDKILAGTTVKNILQLAKRLLEEGLVSAISQEPVPVATARECIEMFLAAGDHHLVPVTHWDDLPVGNGEIGPVTKRIMELVQDDMKHGCGNHYELEYPVVDTAK